MLVWIYEVLLDMLELKGQRFFYVEVRVLHTWLQGRVSYYFYFTTVALALLYGITVDESINVCIYSVQGTVTIFTTS